MKYWKQIEEDACSYYGQFSRIDASQMISEVPNLSICTLNSAFVGKDDFIEVCGNDIINIFSKDNLFSAYKLYLIANIEIKEKGSRIKRYKKVWKLLKTEWQLESIRKGPEIEMALGDKSFYCSVAEFSLENIFTILKIVAKNPFKFTIIESKRDYIITEESIRNIFNVAFNEIDLKFPVIDYFNLSLNLCSIGDIVFRWGDSSEEITLALIFKYNLLRDFDNLLKNTYEKGVGLFLF